MLQTALLRVSRAGGGYHPQFADREHRPLAARVIGTFQGHVDEPRGDLDDALETLESDSGDFKLVRGFAALLEREAAFETVSPVDPARVRRVTFEAAESVGVVSSAERTEALDRASETLGVDLDTVDGALYADRESREYLVAFVSPWDPSELVAQYNLSLAQTALFRATEVRIRSSDPKRLVSAVKRFGLLYEIEKTDRGRELVVTGPTRLFGPTSRYGTRFARLLRTIAGTTEWHLRATIDDRGTERTMTLDDDDPVRVPDANPVAEVSYDSDVEADFAARFSSLNLDWELSREPEALETGTRVMIPDFAFEYRHATGASNAQRSNSDGPCSDAPGSAVSNAEATADGFRVYFEIMGFWTPEYVEKKLGQLEALEDVDMLVAVDESLGVSETISDLDHRVVTYTDRVRVKDVADVLSSYETALVAASVERLPAEITPEDDVVSLETLAARHVVSEDALEAGDVSFPEHRVVGRTLLRPGVLDALDDEIEPGMSVKALESVLDERAVGETSAVLSRLGYRVEWDGLSGGTVREA